MRVVKQPNRWVRLILGFSFVLLASQPLNAATVLGAYAIINVPLLNVRSGPGLHYDLVESVVADRSLPVIGRSPDCAWLQVVVTGKGVGWLAAPHVILSQRCQDLPAVAITPAPQRQEQPGALSLATPPQPSEAVAPASANPCTNLPNEEYGALTVSSAPTDRPAAHHADLNLALRSYQASREETAILSFGPVHEIDQQAPQLRDLFRDQRQPAVSGVFQVFDWDWGCNCPGDLLTTPPVTLAGFTVTPGEHIYTPDSPRTIGDGYEALVLYATPDQVTIKFTREDNVISGYTLHAAGICVNPALLTLYTSLDQAGRSRLPALRGGQSFGTALTNSIQIAIRDNGQFLDPRYLENWWR